MKLSKKVLAAFASMAAIAMVGTFVSCTEDSDDDYGIITKDNQDNFSINYTNDSDSVQRGYETTKAKHKGALTKITMNKASANAGAMGYIWDLEAAKEDGTYSREAKDTRRFLIAGFSYTGTAVKPYVSLYKDVVDIQANNFGATGTAQKETEAATAVGSATETEYLKFGSKSIAVTPDATTGDFDLTLDIYESGEWTWNEKKDKRVYTSYDGGYVVDIYKGALTLAEVAEKNTDSTATGYADATTSVPAADLGYLAALQTKYADDADKLAKITESSIVSQQTCAVYANVYAKKTLKGAFNYTESYGADEVVED